MEIFHLFISVYRKVMISPILLYSQPQITVVDSFSLQLVSQRLPVPGAKWGLVFNLIGMMLWPIDLE
jgi:hypothetical protein